MARESIIATMELVHQHELHAVLVPGTPLVLKLAYALIHRLLSCSRGSVESVSR